MCVTVLSPKLLPNGMQIELDLLPDVSTHPLFPDKSLLQQFYHCKLSAPPRNQPILPFSKDHLPSLHNVLLNLPDNAHICGKILIWHENKK